MTRREEAISLLGGKCVKCQSSKDLQFDHIDPLSKTIEIGRALKGKPSVLEAELAKCQLLCYSCHKEKSAKEIRVRRPLPSFRGYKKGCRCRMYRVTLKETEMKANPPKKRWTKAYTFQRWYFWSKKYLKDNE